MSKKVYMKRSISEDRITKSYDKPLNRRDVQLLIGKILARYQKDRIINNMRIWLQKNNFGDYSQNKWVRAVVDTLFKRVGGIWEPINTNKSIDQLTQLAMTHWQRKLSEELNEDVAITDPTLAQQYLAVKKQIADKQTKKDELMKSVNQVDNEMNILQKNLLAIEVKATSTTTKQTQQKPDQKHPEQTQQTQQTQKTNQNESYKPLYRDITDKISYDDFKELVIESLDELYSDGETLVYEYQPMVKKMFRNRFTPQNVALMIMQLELNTEDEDEEFENYKKNWINGVNESVNVYDDIIGNIEQELNKLSDIKNFIENYDDKGIDSNSNNTDINIDINVDSADNEEETLIASEPVPLIGQDNDDLKFYDDLDDEHLEPFVKGYDEQLVDETLKAEQKPPYVPPLIEQEDIENELDMLNYEDDDEPRDEYVFHIIIDEGTNEEIITKIYKENEDDNWTARVVKGDEEPLQSMEFDSRLNKLDIIGHLADMYGEIEIIDPKEYEYLLDDKEKVDTEYYDNLTENLKEDNWKSLMDKYDLKYFREYQHMSKIDLEQMREDWKVMRRFALNKLNQELASLGKKGQLLNMDVSDDELYLYLDDKDKHLFFKYSRILDFSDGYKPKDLIIIKK